MHLGPVEEGVGLVGWLVGWLVFVVPGFLNHQQGRKNATGVAQEDGAGLKAQD